MLSNSGSRTLTASCHCRNIQFTVTVPADTIPLKTHLCHCNLCRYIHGSLCSFHASLPTGVQPQFIAPSNKDKLTLYAPTSCPRYFCSTCGCHIGDLDQDGRWLISSAIFDTQDQGCFKINAQIHAETSQDGGLSALLPRIGNSQAAVPEPPTQHSNSDSSAKKRESDDLLAQCHCGGVSFTISRPKERFLETPTNRLWTSPSDSTKWLACLDVCDDCRLVTGTNVIGWIFIPTDHISPSPVEDLLIGTSKSYHSSKDVTRTFCGTCGATVFYSCVSRPSIVDVAVGILRDPKGVMVEDWAVWRTGRIAHLENGRRYDAGFAEALKEGFEEWGVKKYGRIVDFDIPG